MGAFETIVQVMMDMNVFQLFFPWLLVLAITYGALNKYDVFEDEGVNGIVALSLAFLTIAGIYVYAPAGIFINFAVVIAFSIFALLGMVMLLTIAGVDLSEWEDPSDELPAKIGITLIIVGIVGVLWIYLPIADWLNATRTGPALFNDVVMPVLVLVFLFLVIGAVGSGGGGD